MAELHIKTSVDERVEPLLRQFADEWGCELAPVEAGYLLLPEIMLRKYGVFVFRIDGGYKVCREEDATTWEDFLMMKLAHSLADRWRASLWLEGREEPLEVEPHRFETFEHYVEKVLEFEDDLVREMKKYWIYAHQKRSVR